MAKGNYKTGHVWFDAKDMRQARKVAAYWRRWLLLPHTKVHIRRGHRVVVNLYTLLETFRFMYHREECIRYYQHRGSRITPTDDRETTDIQPREEYDCKRTI